MANDSVVEQIVRSLSFEVEAVPQDNVIQVTTTSNTTPMNVKIRVRKKAEAGLRQGILSIPIPNRPDSIPERIRLVSSDQTIMSFDVVMESEFEKPIKKSRKTILGAFIPTICLGAHPEEDNYVYMPSTTYGANINDESSSQSERALRSAFTLTKNEKNAKRVRSHKKNNYFGKCKPGGCLDPPFGEDRQPYKPAPIVIEQQTKTPEPNTTINIEQTLAKGGCLDPPFGEDRQPYKPAYIVAEQQIKVPDQNTTKPIVQAPVKDRTSSIFSNKILSKKKKSKEESTDNNVIKIGAKTESVLDLYQSGALQTSKTVSSIMTYPPTSNSSDHLTQEVKQRDSRIYDDSSKNSVDVHSGSYFTIPKGTKNVLDKSIIFKTDDKINIPNTKEVTVKKSEPTYKNDVPLTNMEGENKKVLRTLSSTDSVTDRGSERYLIQHPNKDDTDLLVRAPKDIFTKPEQIQSQKELNETDSKPVKGGNMDTEILSTIPPAILLVSGAAAKSIIAKAPDKDTDETKINDGIETIWSPKKPVTSDMIENSDTANSQNIEMKTTPKGLQEKQDDKISQSLSKEGIIGSSKTDILSNDRVDIKSTIDPKGVSEKEDMITQKSPNLEDSGYLKTDIPDAIRWSDEKPKEVKLSQSVSNIILKDQNPEKIREAEHKVPSKEEQIKEAEHKIIPSADLKSEHSAVDPSKVVETQSDKMLPTIKPVLPQNIDKSALTLDSTHEKSDYDIKTYNAPDSTVGKVSTDFKDMVSPIKRDTILDVINSVDGDLYHLWKNETHSIDSSTKIFPQGNHPVEMETQRDHLNESIDTLSESQNKTLNAFPDKIASEKEKKHYVEENHTDEIKEGNVRKKEELVSTPTVPMTNKDKEASLPSNLVENNIQVQSKDIDQSEINQDIAQVQDSHLASPIENNIKKSPKNDSIDAESKNDFQVHSPFLVSPKNEENILTETSFHINPMSDSVKTTLNEAYISSHSIDEKLQTQSSSTVVKPITDSGQIMTVLPVNPTGETKMEDDLQSKLSANSTEDQFKETGTPLSLQDDDFQTQSKIPVSIIKENNQEETTLSVTPLSNAVETKSEEDDFQSNSKDDSFKTQSMFSPREYIGQTETILPIGIDDKVEVEPNKADFQLVSNVDNFQTQSTFPSGSQEDDDHTETTFSSPLSGSVDPEIIEDDVQSESERDDFHSQSQSMFPVSSKELLNQAEAVLPISSLNDKIVGKSQEDDLRSGLKDNDLQIQHTFPVSPNKENEQSETNFSTSPLRVETKFSQDDIQFESFEDKFPMHSMHSIDEIQTIFNQDDKKTFDKITSDLLPEPTYSKFEIHTTYDTTQPVNITNIKDKEDIPKYDDYNKDLFDFESEEKVIQDYNKINQGLENLVNAEITDHHIEKHITFGDDIKLYKENESATIISSPKQIETHDNFIAEVDRNIFENIEAGRNFQENMTVTHAENMGFIPEHNTIKLADIATMNKPFSNNLSLLQTPETNKAGTYQINIAIQSYLGEKNEVTIRSFNAEEEPIRFINDTINIIHTNLDNDNEIKIPIDLNNDLCIIIKQKDLVGAAHTLHTEMTDQLSEYKNEPDPIKRNVIIADDVRKTLVAVYEEELLPLRSTIAELKVNIEMLKAFVKKQRLGRIVPIYRKCSCMRR